MTTQLEREEIERNISRLHLTLSETPNDHPYMPLMLAALGLVYEHRFDLTNEPGDIDKAIEYGSVAVSMTPDGYPEQLDPLDYHPGSHIKPIPQIGAVNYGKKAGENQSPVSGLVLDGYLDLPWLLANLGVSHNIRYRHLGELSDLDKSIECNTRAVLLTPDGHPDLPSRLTNLGVSHSNRYNWQGELDDLEKAIECKSRAVALTPEGHPDFPSYLASLGASHSNRYKRLGVPDDNERAIECESHAVALTPEGDPHLPSRLSNLGVSYGDRYAHLGDLDDLRKAIGYESRAVVLSPEGHPDLPNYLTNLGAFHSRQYERLGELNDLEKAIESTSRAVSLTPEGDPHLPKRLTNLELSHSNRYQRLGELSDIENAIECGTRAVALTPESHPDLPTCLTSLGVPHRHRYTRLRESRDLEKMIECDTRALSLTPDGHPDLPGRLANLGLSHRDQYDRLGDSNDLEKAIKFMSHAIALTPEGHPNLTVHLTNLGMSHLSRYECLGEPSDMDDAIEYQTRALGLLPDGHPDLSIWHFNYATILILRYKQSGNPFHLQESLRYFRSASQTITGSPRDKYRNASAWAMGSLMYNSLNPIEAFQTAIDLLPQFIWLGATIHQRYQDLAKTRSLAPYAACAAIRFSTCSLALEWLEQARCVVWNQSLMLRTPVDQLQTDHPTLAARLQTVAHQLHSTSSQSRESRVLSSGSLTMDQVAQEHRRLAVEYNELIAQARTLPGFADFLRPMRETGLVRAARYGPIAVINCHEDRCDALVIIPGRDNIQHIPLPNFTGEGAQTARSYVQGSIKSKGLRERGVKHKKQAEPAVPLASVLAGLWYNVVKPVLDFLGYTKNVGTSHLPHITWCPTGVMSFLPLHAAGDYDEPQSRIYDYVISSYTPTVTALLSVSPSTLSAGSRVLAIGQQATPGHSPLPGTARELELIHAHVQPTTQYTQLSNNQATTSAVLDAMEQHDWVHLACHAHQNVNDPTKSGFFLHDGTVRPPEVEFPPEVEYALLTQ